MEEELDPYGLSPLEFNLLRDCSNAAVHPTEWAAEARRCIPHKPNRNYPGRKGTAGKAALRSDRRIVAESVRRGQPSDSHPLSACSHYAKLLHNVSPEDSGHLRRTRLEVPPSRIP